jgi:hypothetical protein
MTVGPKAEARSRPAPGLPSAGADPPHRVRIAALGDLHYQRESAGSLQPLLGQAARSADVLALCGDIIDYGLPAEARLFAKEFSRS